MRKKLSCLMVLTGLAVLAVAAPASADVTIGSTTQPTGSTPGCSPGAIFAASPSDTPYSVPEGGGTITSWSINTAGATPGAAIELVVLRAESAGETVVGGDAEALPSTLPASGVVTFSVAGSLPVQAGDTLGLYEPKAGATCDFHGGSTPLSDTMVAYPTSTAPAQGQVLTTAYTSPAGYVPDVAATVAQSGDAAVTTASNPTSVQVGNLAVFGSTVTNNGAAATTITFTDTVPAGLSVVAAAAGNGTCTTSGQSVSCTMNVPAGASAPADIVVKAPSPGTYANAVAVALPSGFTDTNTANNTAGSTLTVTPVPAPAAAPCVVPNLKGVSRRTATAILKDLDCKVAIHKVRSKRVHKGNVVRTRPGAGTYSAGATVTLDVSKGAKHHKKHHHKKKK